MTIEAGMTLRALAAIEAGQQTFTRAQVAYLINLAYETGRRHTLAENLAETIACWDARRTPAQTRDQRKAARMAEMDAYARARAEREGRPYAPHLGGPVCWETSRPLRPRLESVAA